MRKLIICLILSIIPIGLVGQNSTTRYYTPYATESLTIDDTSGGIGFTTAKIFPSNQSFQANAVQFRVTCSSGTSCPINYTIDGTAPTSSIGTLLDYKDLVTIYGITSIKNFRAIRTGSTSAVIQPTYSF